MDVPQITLEMPQTIVSFCDIPMHQIFKRGATSRGTRDGHFSGTCDLTLSFRVRFIFFLSCVLSFSMDIELCHCFVRLRIPLFMQCILSLKSADSRMLTLYSDGELKQLTMAEDNTCLSRG